MTSELSNIQVGGITANVPLVAQFASPVETLVLLYLNRQERRTLAESQEFGSRHSFLPVKRKFEEEEVEDAPSRRMGFDQVMIDLIRDEGVSLWRLPIAMDIGTLDQSDFMKTGTEYGIMRYGERAGFLLNVRKKKGVDQETSALPQQLQFKVTYRGPVEPSLCGERLEWLTCGQWGYEIGRVSRERHLALHHKGKEHMCVCPEFRTGFLSAEAQAKTLVRIIRNEDPLFELAGTVAQVANPLPTPEPRAMIEAPRSETPGCARNGRRGA